MTVNKTKAEIDARSAASSDDPAERPLFKGDVPEKDAATLKARWPSAREIELLPSGNYAIRFRRKPTVYWRRNRDKR